MFTNKIIYVKLYQIDWGQNVPPLPKQYAFFQRKLYPNCLKECVMPDYIVCQKKRNNPRMDIRICERRCPEKGECKGYLVHQRVAPQAAQPAPQAEASALELEAA